MLDSEFVVRRYQNGSYELICTTSGARKLRYANGDTVVSLAGRVIHYITHDYQSWIENSEEASNAIKSIQKMNVRCGAVY